MTEKSVSFSEYQVWATCPKQWKLKYVDKAAPYEDSIHTVFGDAMHKTIQTWSMETKNKSDKVAARYDLSEPLKENLKERFTKSITEVNGVKQFVCDKPTLEEFYSDGIEILGYLQKHRATIFGTEDWELISVEERVEYPLENNLKFKGFLDLVFKNRLTGGYKIVDLKTSTRGWNEYTKKDPKKINQILLYKQFYGKLYQISPDYIKVEFIILKRKINPAARFPIPRITKIEPAQGTASVRKAVDSFMQFVTECYEQGIPIPIVKADPNKSNCKYCPFNNNKSLCKESFYLDKKFSLTEEE